MAFGMGTVMDAKPVERLVESWFTKALARGAMIATPIMLISAGGLAPFDMVETRISAVDVRLTRIEGKIDEGLTQAINNQGSILVQLKAELDRAEASIVANDRRITVLEERMRMMNDR